MAKRGRSYDYTDKYTVNDEDITDEYVQPKSCKPVKLTPEVIKAVGDSIRNGNSLETACAFAGISKRTLHDWCEKGRRQKRGIHRQFIDEINAAMTDVEGQVVNALMNKIRDGDMKAIEFWLKHRRSKQWSDKTAVQVGTGGNGKIVVIYEDMAKPVVSEDEEDAKVK